MSDTALRHVEHLAKTIGPRGSTTAQERQGHEYCQATLKELGYDAHRDEFLAPVSGWTAYSLAFGMMLLAIGLFVLIGRGANAQAGAAGAAALGLIIVVAFFLQVLNRPSPLEWFVPVGGSQNVWAVAEPRGEVRRRAVLVGHVDTHRTALAMQSPALWQVFQVLTTLVSLAMIALVAIFIWGIVTPDPLPRTIALYLAIPLLAALVFTAQPDYTRFVPGANDNATGAAAVLALAERLKREPLEHTQVFLLNSGCEEVGPHGVSDWIRRHAAADAPGAYYLVLDTIGGKGSDVNYLLDETVVLPVKSDPDLITLAEAAARANPQIGAQPFHFRGMFSELSYATHAGQKAIGLLNFDPKTKMLPGWHTQRDTVDLIDPALLDRSEQFAWAILKQIDAQAPQA